MFRKISNKKIVNLSFFLLSKVFVCLLEKEKNDIIWRKGGVNDAIRN